MSSTIFKHSKLSLILTTTMVFMVNCQGNEPTTGKAKTASEHATGVYIYNRTIDKYSEAPNELIKICSKIGITEVYMNFSKNRFKKNTLQYKSRLNDFIKRFHQAKIKVYALSFSTPTLIFNKAKAAELTETIKTYNRDSESLSKFDGISADLEPHMLKESASHKWGKTPLYWTKNGYQGDNLKMLNLTYETLSQAKKKMGAMTLSEAVPAFYLKRFPEVKLINRFIEKGCDYIILMAYSDKVEQVIKRANNALSSSNGDKTVMICVKTSIGTKGGGGEKTSFHGINKTTLQKNIKQINQALKQHRAFRGIAFFEFEGLAEIWKKQ